MARPLFLYLGPLVVGQAGYERNSRIVINYVRNFDGLEGDEGGADVSGFYGTLPDRAIDRAATETRRTLLSL